MGHSINACMVNIYCDYIIDIGEMMALQALLPYLPTAVSALGSMFSGTEDPESWKREELKKLIEEIRGEFPKMAAALRTREAVERGGMQRRVSDVGAAGGLPRNVISQNIASVGLGSQRNLSESLARLDQQKLQSMQNVGGLIQGTPQEQTGFPWEQLLNVSLYDLIGGGPLSSGLGNLFGGQGQGGGSGIPGLPDLNKLKLNTMDRPLLNR